MNTSQFESDERNRPWRKDAAPVTKPPSNPEYPKKPFNHDEWMKSSKPMEEGSDIPVPGDTIRTPKLEGKVSKVEEGYVYFTTADGRNMRNTVKNCTVVEKLADQENEMCEDEELDEVSTELLSKYKTAAGKDASAADKSGDYARGNKRFSGIVKATKKQFDNDAKKKTEEGSMGGINRSAPSNDVSYEKVLDETDEIFEKCWKDYKQIGMKKKGGKSVPNCVPANEDAINELSVGTLNSYKDAANSPNNFRTRPLRKLAKTVDGVKTATQKINTKTGKRSGISQPGRGEMEEDLRATFGDLLGKQHQEKEKVTKIDVTKLPSKNKNFAIWFKPQTDKLKPVKWQVRSKDGSVTKHEGSSSNEKDAFNDAEDWIAKSDETSSASNNVTVNFNAAFARDVAPDGQTLWTTFWEGPIFVYSESPQEGYTRTVIRTPDHSRTAGAALLPVTGMSPKKANEIGLRTNSRYTLGPREELQPGVYGYTLQWHSRVEKGIPVPLKEPSITTSSKEEAVSEVYQGPHLGDPSKLAKAPKSQMQGKDGVTFSELVQDTISVHGVKDAFEFYVKKHGLSPRQFQIYAGLTVDRPPARPKDPAQGGSASSK